MEEFPKEIRSPPTPLIALVGAQHFHSKIIDALHQCALQSGSKRCKFISADYDFEVVPKKPKSGKPQDPLGVLKRSWLTKMCHKTPAVCVACFDWTQWKDDLPELEKKISSLSTLRRRGARLAAIVMNKTTGDTSTPFAPLRLGASLFVCASHDEFLQRAAAMEKHFFDAALTWYREEENRAVASIKGVTNSKLLARVTFKAAFLSEFRKETRAGLKNYQQAYQILTDDITSGSVVERMHLMSFCTVRLLYMLCWDISSAVQHLKVHVKNLHKFLQSLDCIHQWRVWYWLATNYQLFAEFLESVSAQMNTLIDKSDIQQCPGYYYNCAAASMRELKKCCRDIHITCRKPDDAELAGSPFWGHVGTMDGSVSAMELLEAHLQTQANHANKCVELLSLAHTQFKDREYAREMTAVAIRIAEEYFSEKDYSMASRLYDGLEKQVVVWPKQRVHVLQRTCESCFHLLECEPPEITVAPQLSTQTDKPTKIPPDLNVAEIQRRLVRTGITLLSHLVLQCRASLEDLISLFSSLVPHAEGSDIPESEVDFDASIAYVGMEKGRLHVRVKLLVNIDIPVGTCSAVALSGTIELTPGEDSDGRFPLELWSAPLRGRNNLTVKSVNIGWRGTKWKLAIRTVHSLADQDESPWESAQCIWLCRPLHPLLRVSKKKGTMLVPAGTNTLSCKVLPHPSTLMASEPFLLYVVLQPENIEDLTFRYDVSCDDFKLALFNEQNERIDVPEEGLPLEEVLVVKHEEGMLLPVVIEARAVVEGLKFQLEGIDKRADLPVQLAFVDPIGILFEYITYAARHVDSPSVLLKASVKAATPDDLDLQLTHAEVDSGRLVGSPGELYSGATRTFLLFDATRFTIRFRRKDDREVYVQNFSNEQIACWQLPVKSDSMPLVLKLTHPSTAKIHKRILLELAIQNTGESLKQVCVTITRNEHYFLIGPVSYNVMVHPGKVESRTITCVPLTSGERVPVPEIMVRCGEDEMRCGVSDTFVFPVGLTPMTRTAITTAH
eukprot:GEMP01006479.1.p1 GENE.GEMP01006479.1~~GEMP01006479.1.p1  ORF type:complete len:1011 (+),score=224.79 GEMP01006479.1:175-3207(+)